MRFDRLLLAGTALAAFTAPAFAQSAETPAPTQTAQADTAAADNASEEVILVTGSRIARPNLDSAVPVTSLAGEQFFQTGQNNIGDELNSLPQLRSTFAQQNPGLGVGIAGLNLLDLRGLGTARTLVLVNGRRHVAADILSNAVSPDVNSIPNDLIERVDIVTGSQSATYGSDAIAGVVNFVLKREFEGVQVRGNAAQADAGFGANQYGSIMVGKNFADGRANITVHGEYAHQERVFGSDVPWDRRQDGLVTIDVDPAGLPNGSDGVADRNFFRDIRSSTINRFGLIPITQNSTTAACGTGLGATNGAAGVGSGSTVGLPYNCTFIFDAAGNLSPQTGTRISTGLNSVVIGGNGQAGREDKLLSVIPYQERININLLAHFQVSDAFEPFVEAKWNRINALGSNAGPSFIQGTFTQLDIRERIRLDNPYLSATQRTTIANAILASGCNTSLTASCNVAGIAASSTRLTRSDTTQGVGGPLNAADIAAINAGTYRFVLSRNLLDSGIRDEEFQRDTYRIVGGARGTFNGDWNYELSLNYGKFTEDTVTYGYLDRQRFLLSLDAGRNPTTGAIECRSKFDPASATAFALAGGAPRLAADIAACVPYNPFGAADNSAASKYFVYNALNTASLRQFDAMGYVNGDLSQLFELPGGPIGFVIGGEYREEKADYTNDPFIESGATNAVVVGRFDPPTFSVAEAFGEVRVPLLKDLPMIQELSLTGAGRYSDYKGGVGTVWTYNAGAEYQPFDGLRFRGGYGKAVRAPNVSETGFPAVPNFAPGFLDPCSPSQIAGNPNRLPNCTADLGATLLAGLPSTAYSLPIISGSNVNLKPEVSKSLTLGGVLTPSFVPGLSISADYYDIKVTGVIVSLTAQQIANGCYDQPSIVGNPLCSVFTRWRGPGTGPLGELPGQILGNSLVSAPVNFAKRIRRGIDFNVGYRTELFDTVKMDSQLIYVRTLKASNFQNPSLPNFENRILSELGDPENEFRLDADFTVGKFTFGYRMHFIDKMYVNLYEDFNPLPTACSTTSCPPNDLDYSAIAQFPSVFYHDVRFQYVFDSLGGFGKDFMIYAGIDNVFDKHPPLGSTATGSGSAIYDARGRNFYAGFRARF